MSETKRAIRPDSSPTILSLKQPQTDRRADPASAKTRTSVRNGAHILKVQPATGSSIAQSSAAMRESYTLSAVLSSPDRLAVRSEIISSRSFPRRNPNKGAFSLHPTRPLSAEATILIEGGVQGIQSFAARFRSFDGFESNPHNLVKTRMER